MKKHTDNLTWEKIDFKDENFKVLAMDVAEYEATEKALHREIEIKYFYEGKSDLIIDTRNISASCGDIVIINPYEVHSKIDTAKSSGKYYILLIDLDFLINQPNGLNLRNILITQGVKFNNLIRGADRLQTIIRRVFEEMNGQRKYYRLVVYSLLNELFALLLRENVNPFAVAAKRAAKSAELLSPALEIIFENYKRHITVEELARACNLSKYYFCRLFKREMGATVVHYITKYKISVAEMLLTTTDNTITEIAYQSGFEDVSYFNRCYKTIKGTTPRQARNLSDSTVTEKP